MAAASLAPFDPAAFKNQLMGTMQIDPTRLNGFTGGQPILDRLMAQYNQLMGQYGGYEQEIGNAQADYDLNQADLSRQAIERRRQFQNSMADRGGLESGVFLSGLGDIDSENQAQLSRMAQAKMQREAAARQSQQDTMNQWNTEQATAGNEYAKLAADWLTSQGTTDIANPAASPAMTNIINGYDFNKTGTPGYPTQQELDRFFASGATAAPAPVARPAAPKPIAQPVAPKPVAAAPKPVAPTPAPKPVAAPMPKQTGKNKWN